GVGPRRWRCGPYLQPGSRGHTFDRSRDARGGGARRPRRRKGGRSVTIGVLVMAYGTPTTPDDVEAYYTRIRHGRAPTGEQLADLQRRYNAIGGTSPLAQRSNDQVAGLAAQLERHVPGGFDVRFGSKYEPPLL